MCRPLSAAPCRDFLEMHHVIQALADLKFDLLNLI